MTLKEKFETKAIQFPYEANAYAENCEKIADDYVIEVLEWLTKEESKFSIMYGNQEKRFSTIEEDYTAKELLQIFKNNK